MTEAQIEASNAKKDELVFQLIQILISEKQESNIIPDHVTSPYIHNELRESFNRLHKARRILAGDTVQSKYIKIAPQPKTEQPHDDI